MNLLVHLKIFVFIIKKIKSSNKILNLNYFCIKKQNKKLKLKYSQCIFCFQFI